MAQNKVPRSEFDKKIASVKYGDWRALAMGIDCEGCIFINRNVNKRTGKVQHVLTVNFANTDLRLMKWVTDTFGGSTYFSHSESQRKWSKKVCHSWRVFEDRAAVILEHCLPYLICKRAQAEIALAYRELRKAGSKGRKLVNDDIAARDACYAQIRELNSGSMKWNYAKKFDVDGSTVGDIKCPETVN